MSRKIFTIGHSNHNIDKFIQLLKEHQVTAIGDVRSSPYSRYLSHFKQAELEFYLKDNEINYVFLGKELGARPEDENCYVDGKAIYEKIAARALFKAKVTDIVMIDKLNQGLDINGKECLFTISLAQPWRRNESDELSCWKLIAGVIELF